MSNKSGSIWDSYGDTESGLSSLWAGLDTTTCWSAPEQPHTSLSPPGSCLSLSNYSDIRRGARQVGRSDSIDVGFRSKF